MKVEFILLFIFIYTTRTIECAAVEAPLDIITLEDLTPLERAHLQYLRETSNRQKRSDLLSSLGQGIKSKIGLLAQGSAAAVSHFSGSSSGGHHAHPHEVPESYGHKSFDFWSLKKSILNTLLQAAKAIKGGVIALKGQLIKGSGYLVSAKGKLITKSGEAVTTLGKNIATSAVLVPHKGYSHSSGYGASGPSYESPHSDYGPPSGHDEYASPSAPSPEYGYPVQPDAYGSQKYPVHYEEKHKTVHGVPQGLLILKKIPLDRHEENQDTKIPEFKPLKPQSPVPTMHSFIKTFFASSSQSHKSQPPPTDDHDYQNSKPVQEEEEEHNIIKPTVAHSQPSLSEPTINYLEYFQNVKPSQQAGLKEQLPTQFDVQTNTQLTNAVDLNNSLNPIHYQSAVLPNFENQNFFINGNPINVNDLPSIESFGPYPGPLPAEFISQQNLDSQTPIQTSHSGDTKNGFNFLQDPRYLNQNAFSFNQNAFSLNSFLPTPDSHSSKYLPTNIPLNLPKQTGHKTSKRTTSGHKNPNMDVVKSISFQLGPNGPVKL